MSLVDILIIVACALFVAVVVIVTVIAKKKGKSSCGCDCANCTLCKRSENGVENTCAGKKPTDKE